MRIGLIDVDGHHFPNLALMKLSAYHKQHSDNVEWWNTDVEYDIVYMSKVFSDTYSPDIPAPLNAKTVIKGGTGYAISTIDGKEVYDCSKNQNLDDEIEHIYPDYSLYPEYTGYGVKSLRHQTAYGFLTRGCPRGCNFCHVAAKEGRKAEKVANLSEFWIGQGNICLSDPNILACKESSELLNQLVESGAKIDFNQGLDARLITQDKAELLAGMKLKAPHFAMDNMDSADAVARGLRLYKESYLQAHNEKWSWRKGKVFVLTNFDTTHEQDMYRISVIQSIGYQPYVMVYDKPNAPAITRRLQRWTNNSFCYGATQDFYEYQKHTYKHVLYE